MRAHQLALYLPRPQTHIESLNLSYLVMEANGVRPIRNGLLTVTTLRVLKLLSCNIDNEAAELLARGLESNYYSLNSINLSSNPFTHSGLVVSVNAVGAKPHFEELVLREVRPCRSDTGFVALAPAWAKCFSHRHRPTEQHDPEIHRECMMRCLDLVKSFLSDYEWEVLSRVLPLMKRLEQMNLKGVEYSFDGLDGPLELMRSFKSVEAYQNINDRFVLLCDS
ncbi:hypothetical protein BJ742DRAFT_769855 [Cladochytrium replicatum]|nr:hypothetical protein BJ742DRAFT_769855 [Cladochytrium replicatum]